MTGPGPSPRGSGFAAIGLATVAAVAATARAQTVDAERPRTLVVGTPPGGARTDRVNASRTGAVSSVLPTSWLRVDWRASLGAILEQAPLVDAQGVTYVVGTRGEVAAIARDGSEKWRGSTDATLPGPPALLSDGTLVFVGGAGEAIAVRAGQVRWRTRIGRGDSRPAPLPLDDGGVVVGTGPELVALDAVGHERARAALPEPIALPLVAALGKVVAVTATGQIWTWTPGAAEASRVSSFGSPVDGSSALADDHTLVAVTSGGAHLTAVDLLRGTVTTRATASEGPWLGPPAMLGGTAFLRALTSAGEIALALDAAGREIARVALGTRGAPASADAGVLAAVPGPHTGPIVDRSGTLVFATSEGNLGVAAAMLEGQGSAEVLSTQCGPPAGPRALAVAPIAGLAPLPPDEFVAVCRYGTVLAVKRTGSGDSTPQRL